jgi:long chain fatty acid CoA FadD26
MPAVLAERARQDPDGSAYTFIDYEVDPAGYAETLTWSEVYDRAQVIAHEVACCGSPGDRVAIMAPQGLEYVVGFFGVLMAGFIAVPLSVPMYGTHDERVAEAIKDSSPSAVLTTSAIADDVAAFVGALPGSTPTVIQLDALDFYTPPEPIEQPSTKTALLQYTSGSTRVPAAVMVSHKNISANVDQVFADYFAEDGGWPPRDTTVVSWLPFYHDMGLLLGLIAPVMAHNPAVIMSPMAFLQKPARWVQLLASYRSFSAAPNFAFGLAAHRTCDEDMAGFDLGNAHTVLSGAERIHAATLRRFIERFAPLGLSADVVAPSYGLAEAMVYAGSPARADRPTTARFDYEKLAAGHAQTCDSDDGVEIVSIGAQRACTVRIVDPETSTEAPASKVGEVWLHGDNVSSGYWRNPQQTEETFGGRLADPSPGTPVGPWLRTGDLGVMTDGQLYIVGRIKDLLIIDGRNHYPDDIEATISEITRGRVAAVSVPGDGREHLVTIAEVKTKGSDEELADRLRTMKRDVTTTVSSRHAVRVSDLVPVPPGSLPITTSGKVRRAACTERYRNDEFTRLDTA